MVFERVLCAVAGIDADECGREVSALFGIAYVGCMFLYDGLLVRLLPVYATRVRPKFKALLGGK